MSRQFEIGGENKPQTYQIYWIEEFCCLLSHRLVTGVIHDRSMPSNTKKYSLPINIRAQLYKGRITLSNGEIAIQPISDGKTYSVIYRIESYPVNRVIWPSNNLGLRYRSWWKAAAIFHKINGCFRSIEILQLWLSRSQVAQDPAVGWSSCELRVMAKL